MSTNTIPYARNLTKKSKQANGIAMTVEEAKLMRIIRDQFDRKGGFVRIFPSADTWKKYSKYLGKSTNFMKQYFHRECKTEKYLHVYRNR